jgi:hypothetical protein
VAPAIAETAPDFQQVLAAPDDAAQNLAYARAEANAGHLLNAAAALERILLIAPGENGVRLFYVAVLCRLEDFQGAQQQLNALDPSTLTPLQRAELEKYRARIARDRSKLKVSGNVAAGLGYESDAGGALRSELDIAGPVPKKSGAAAVTSGRLDMLDDISEDGDLAAFASLLAYSRSSFSGPDANYLSATANFGVMGSQLHSAWQFGGVIHRYQLFNAPYLTEIGGRAEYDWHPDTALTWFASFEGVSQNYHEPQIAELVPKFISGTHSGDRFDFSGGATWRLSATSTLTGILGFETKTASYEPFAYDAPYLNADYHALLGNGVYADASGDIRYVDYQKFDAFFLGTRREDTRESVRVALGAPLSAFTAAGATGDYRENLILEGAVTYAGRTSRAPVVDYSSGGVELRLIWKFGDGN